MLHIEYSKQLIKKLGKIPVCLPGDSVNVGDIIEFPYGKSFFGNPRPLGTFKKITSLDELGVSYKKPEFSNSPDTYHFSTKDSKIFNTSLDSTIDLKNDMLPSAKGKMNIQFNSEGAIYFLGVNCNKKQLSSIVSLEKGIPSKGKEILWEDTYLVTSVTIAEKAFISQSLSQSSGFTLEGDVKGIQVGNSDISTNIELQLKKQSGNVFIKEWSENVTVFMDVMKFEKKIFESETTIQRASNQNSKIKYTEINIEELKSEELNKNNQ